MKRTIVVITGAAMFIAGCALHAPKSAPSGFLDISHHRTVVQIYDITAGADPEHRILLTYQEGNAISSCGIRDIMTIMTGAPDMGPSESSADDLGKWCVGLNVLGQQKVPDKFNHGNVVILVGRACAGTGGQNCSAPCTTSGSPWKCCTGANTGCTPSNLDILTFIEGQPNQSLVGIQANYDAWSQAYTGNLVQLSDQSSDPIWDGGNLEGIRVTATAGSASGNQQWCEYAVATSPVGPTKAAIVRTDASNTSGWRLNHGLINPCLTKSSGQVFQIIVTILFT